MSDLNITLTNEVEDALSSGILDYEKLNALVAECQKAHVVSQSVEDSVYDQLTLQLQEARNSLEAKGITVSDCVLDRLWEDSVEDAGGLVGSLVSENPTVDEDIELLDSEMDGFYVEVDPSSLPASPDRRHAEYYMEYFGTPMFSISTVKDWEDRKISALANLKQNLHLSYKLNGHAIRVFYEDGKLVHAATRGRVSNSKNVTRQLTNILGEYNHSLRDLGTVEVRGEVALKEENLEKAREFTPNLKSAFSAVSSMIKASTTENENKLLDFIAYKIFPDDDYKTKGEEYDALKSFGFQTPPYSISKVEGIEDLKKAFTLFEDQQERYGYMCDGVVAEVNSRELFNELGNDGVRNVGNIALKVGAWSQDMYTGLAQHVTWNSTKDRFTPVVVVSDVDDASQGVLTAQGNRVRNVPVYNLRSMLQLGIERGGLVHFRYGGEAGVVPCDSKGQLLKDMIQDYVG